MILYLTIACNNQVFFSVKAIPVTDESRDNSNIELLCTNKLLNKQAINEFD